MTENEHSEIKFLLAENKIEFAISKLTEKTKGTKYVNTAIELSSRLNQIEGDYNRGHLSLEDKSIQYNRLVTAVISFSDYLYSKNIEYNSSENRSKTPFRYFILVGILLIGCPFIYQYYSERDKIKDARDGHKYTSITIDSLEWLAENMNIDLKNSLSWQYSKKNLNDNLGRLYNFEGAQQACNGLGNKWRLPTKEEITNLGNYLQTSNDSTFFNKFLGGESDNNGTFLYRGENGIIWSDTQSKEKFVWALYVHGIPKKIEIIYHGDQNWGYSCRCVREVENNQ